MRYSQNHTKTHGSWSYTSRSERTHEVYHTVRYVHQSQIAWLGRQGHERSGDNFTVSCDYLDLVNKSGKYEVFKTAVEKDFSNNVFKSLVQKVKNGYVKPVQSEAADDDESNSSINTEPKTIKTPPLPQIMEDEEIAEEVPIADSSPTFSKDYNPSQDWTKTGDSLQSFTWKSLKNAKFKFVPLFVKIIIFPFVGLLILLGALTIYDALFRGRYFMVFIGLLSVGLGLLLLFGIADYWTRKVQRYTKSDFRLIKGRSLLEALRLTFGPKVYLAKPPELSLEKQYTSIIKGRNVTREHIFLGSDFMVGYCELFYTFSGGSKRYTTQRSCFAIKLNHDVEKRFLFDKKISPWFEKQLGVQLSKYLNTRGFFIQSEGNHIILVFKDVLYKSEYIFEVFKSLVAAMESKT